MSSVLVLVLTAVVTAFGGAAAGIVALRKVKTDNLVALRSVANTESDATIHGQAEFNAVLRADSIEVRAQLTAERAAHDVTRGLLVAALRSHV